MNAAVFIGHSECYGLSTDELNKIIINCINSGITQFLSGGQGNFDTACATAVFKFKKDYPHIKNILVIPYLSFNNF